MPLLRPEVGQQVRCSRPYRHQASSQALAQSFGHSIKQGGMMTDFERIELAFDILDNCRLHDTDGSLVLLEVDRKLWEQFTEDDKDE
jgi:hypothetical protein